MGSPKDKCKKGFLAITLGRWKSFNDFFYRKGSSSFIQSAFIRRSKSFTRLTSETQDDQMMIDDLSKKDKQIPDGYFSIYIGPKKERFTIKTEFVNHPLFKRLLEEAELEYGYNNDGPLILPCEVDCFIDVLMQISSNFNEKVFSKYGKKKKIVD